MQHRHRFTNLSKGLNRQRGKMNRTESQYASELEARKLAGEIADWWFEPFTLRLSHPDEGQPLKMTPDFMVLMPDGTTYIIDTKGTGLDDGASLARLKAAAELFPLWRFQLVKKRTKKAGGGWEVRNV